MRLFFVVILIVVLLLIVKKSEQLAGHLRTDRILWQYRKNPNWRGWPGNSFGLLGAIDINTGKPITNWNNGLIGYPPRPYRYNWSGIMHYDLGNTFTGHV